MKNQIVIGVIASLFACGCGKEVVRTKITSLQDIGELGLYKVQNADLLTGKDDDVEVKYIAYTDAIICLDFSKVKIIRRNEMDNRHIYEISFPELTVKQARVIHDAKYSRPWSAKVKRGKSTTKVDNQLKIAAEKAIEVEARKSVHMDRALEQAKSIVETMIRAGDKNAEFEYNSMGIR